MKYQLANQLYRKYQHLYDTDNMIQRNPSVCHNTAARLHQNNRRLHVQLTALALDQFPDGPDIGITAGEHIRFGKDAFQIFVAHSAESGAGGSPGT